MLRENRKAAKTAMENKITNNEKDIFFTLIPVELNPSY
jgi:hypothetical protein